MAQRGPGESYRPDDVAPSVVGLHQPGIATPVLDHLAFAALDVTVQRTADLRDLVDALTVQAQRLMHAEHRSPGAAGPAGALTVTLGLGPGIFGERFGLASRRPVALAELPAFTGDALDASICGGELCVQVCADTSPKADEALERVVAVGRGGSRVRWSQRGFMRRLPGERVDGRPRNLLGFKDATGNPRRGKDLDRHAFMGVHGTADTAVAFQSGTQSRDYWLAANRWTGAAPVPAASPPCVSYEDTLTPVVWCQHSDGHVWPSWAGAAIRSFFLGLTNEHVERRLPGA